MPAGLCRLHMGCRRRLLNLKHLECSKRFVSSGSIGTTPKKKLLWTAAGIVGAGTIGLVYAMENSVAAGELHLHPYKMPWPHNGAFSSMDMKSARRGWEVYKQVCAACHSLDYFHYRDMVNVIMTEDEAKAEANDVMVEDGPDEEGKMFLRPGKIYDKVPPPYKNAKEGAFKNNGAAPPELSLITLARKGAAIQNGGQDYVFSILTGYQDPPAGVKLGPGQAYNPYFLGGAISMPQQLFDEMIEYEDGTPATVSQMAKDVTHFLHWVALPDHDMRKLWFVKLCIFWPLMTALIMYWKRHAWTITKLHKNMFRLVPSRQPPKPKPPQP